MLINNQRFEVLLARTSELVPEGHDGSKDWVNTSYVMRGSSQAASVDVVVRPDVVAINVNRPDGRASRLVIYPNEVRYVAPGDSFRGPLSNKERTEVILDSNGTLLLAEPVVHVSPPGGHSIEFTKHIREKEQSGTRKDPVNAVFYDNGLSGNVGVAMSNGGWSMPWCGGSIKRLFLYDAQHGGTDAWYTQLQHWTKEDACSLDPRYRMRLYAKSSGGWYDDDVPGFEYYSFGPVHYEGINHCCVSPNQGQDKLFADLAPLSITGNIWHAFTANAGGDCDSCGNWNGRVSFYQIYPTSGTSPDPCNRIPTYVVTIQNPWFVLRWSC